MGGWIKVEKDLLTDPRVINLLACNGGPLQDVTHVLGCLTHLWIIADTHVGQDDVLALGAHQIDHILNAQGLCEAMPQDWLQIIDANHVKLPGFHAHNGPQAKARAQTQTRVARHRGGKGNAPPLPPVDDCNARPLPDQTKTKTIKETPLPPIVGLNADAWAEWVTYRIKIRKPLKAVSFPAAQREMASHGAAQAAVVEYSIAHGYQGLFAPHAANGATTGGAPPNRDAATWAEARSLAHDIGFREPYPLESAGSYLTAARYARNTPPPRDVMKRIEGMR